MMAILSKIKSLFVYETIALFAIIYTSNDTLLFGTNSDERFILLKYVVIALLIICGFIKSVGKIYSIKRCLPALVFLFLFFFFNSIFTGFHLGFLYNILLFILALTYVWNVNINRFVTSFQRIIYLLALISIVVQISIFVRPSFIDIFPQYFNSEGFPFHCAYLTMIYDDIQLRNFGIFREPGVYMIYLNMSLFVELFSMKPSIKRTIVVLLASISTVSTAGIAISLSILILFLLFSRNYKTLIGIIPVCLLFYYLITQIPEIYILLFDKIENQTYSSYARIASLVVPFDIFYLYPIGAGPDAYNQLFPILSNARYGVQIDPRDTTNTILKFLAVYGPLVCIFMSYYLYKFTQSFSNKKLFNILLFAVMLIAISNEDLRDSAFFYLLIAYGVLFSVSREREVINNFVIRH